MMDHILTYGTQKMRLAAAQRGKDAPVPTPDRENRLFHGKGHYQAIFCIDVEGKLIIKVALCVALQAGLIPLD